MQYKFSVHCYTRTLYYRTIAFIQYTICNTYLFQYRVFVNRSVSMDRIKYIGFDMDYTLVGEFNVMCTIWTTP